MPLLNRPVKSTKVQGAVVQGLRALYARNAGARMFFKWADTERQNNATSTSIDVVERKSGLDRLSSISLVKELESIGCGTYIVGRRGKKTRISWAYGLKSIARAAVGQGEILEPLDPDNETELAESSSVAIDGPNSDEGISIGEAKRRLALSLGISVEQIEILVKF